MMINKYYLIKYLLIMKDTSKISQDQKLLYFKLYLIFFLLGLICNLGSTLVLNGARLLAREFNMSKYMTIYSSMATLFSLFTRILNSRLCLKIAYKKRIIIISIWIIIGYLSMYYILSLSKIVQDENKPILFIFSFIPCFFLGGSYAFGETAIISYLKMFPKELIGGWSSGTGLSGIICNCLNILTQLIKGVQLKYLYLSLIPLGPIFFILFNWSMDLLTNNKIYLEKRIEIEMSLNKQKNNNNKEKTKLLQKETENKYYKKDDNKNNTETNKTLNFENFKKVMKLKGRIIINLGLIYFIQFVCLNSLTMRNSLKIDIPFLPLACNQFHKTFRKSKFEFINLFFQIGKFISRTFIKFIRKIQPIEIFLIAIGIITIINIIEYYTGLFPWWIYPGLNFSLGFFASGTYATGFYNILQSKELLLEYKELTVNIITIFIDSGVFLSGIFGYFAINYIFPSSEPFKGQEVPQLKECFK